jgi:hypothetical protein
MRAMMLLLSTLFSTGLMAQGKPSERYDNPVDGRTYVAPGGWQTYKPQGGAAQPAAQQKTRLAGVRLLSSQSDFESSVGTQALATYIRQIEKHAAGIFGSSKSGTVLVQINSAPQSQDVKLASQGEIDRVLMQKFYDALMKMERLNVRNKPVAFQVQIAIAP